MATFKRVPSNQVVLDEQPLIKEEIQEPKHEHDDDITHQTDSEASISFDPLNSGDERGGGTGIYDPQLMVSHPQSVLQDIMVQGVPGPSGLPTVSWRFGMVEGNRVDITAFCLFISLSFSCVSSYISWLIAPNSSMHIPLYWQGLIRCWLNDWYHYFI